MLKILLRLQSKAAEKNEDIVYVMNEVVKEAKASLIRTPDLLPVLKEVGVVDSGGQGLVIVYEGFLAELKVKNCLISADSIAINGRTCKC